MKESRFSDIYTSPSDSLLYPRTINRIKCTQMPASPIKDLNLPMQCIPGINTLASITAPALHSVYGSDKFKLVEN